MEQIEEALKGLVKLFKATRFYPENHPALKGTLEESRQALVQPFQGRKSLSLAIRKEGFLLEEKPVGAQNQVLKQLAGLFFVRRIQQLTLLEDLSGEDLEAFTRAIALDPAEIQRQGGLPKILQQEDISTIWVNEIDLEKILKQREILEKVKQGKDPAKLKKDQEETEDEDFSEEFKQEELSEKESRETLEEILEKLRRETDERSYRELLKNLVPVLEKNLVPAARPLVVRAFVLLCRHASDAKTSSHKRELVRQTLHRLLHENVVDFVIRILCLPDLPQDPRNRVMQILQYLRGRFISERLMVFLSAADQAQARKYLAEAMARQGQAGVPVLLRSLEDERWFVVRNAIVILGEIRAPDTTKQIRPLIHHQDFRVRREAIRTLTKIGGSEEVEIFLQILSGKDEDLRRMALLSLGAMKNPAAVPALVRLVATPDPWVKQMEVRKEAIRALSNIRAEDAVPVLIEILQKKKFWGRARFNEIKAAAATALGEIGAPEAREPLEKAVDDRSPKVARAASQALRQFGRG